MTSGWNPPKVNVANGGTPFRIGGETFSRGVGTHAASFYEIEVKGEAVRFTATIGADAGMEIARRGSVRFSVFADGRRVFRSPVHRFGNAAERIDVPLRGAKRVILWVDDAGDGLCNDIADWCEADFEVMPGTTLRPVQYETVPEQFGILSPKIGDEPHLNAPYVFGVRPTHPLLFTLPCSGARPMTFTARLARRTGRTEIEIAEDVLARAQSSEGARRHVGWFLLREVLGAPEKRRDGGWYIAAVVVGTLFLSLLLGFATKSVSGF